MSKASDTSYFYVIDEIGKRLSIENFNYIQFFEENTPFLPGGIFKAENIDGNKCYLDIDCNVIPKALVINSFYVGGRVRVSYNVNRNIYTLQFADRENFSEEIFDDVKIFSDNLFIVYKEGKCGLINSKKRTIIPIEQSYILRCDRKTFWVEKEHKSYFTSEKGDVIGEIFNFGTNEIISRLSLDRYRKVLIDEKKYIFDVKTNKIMKIDTDYIGLYFDDKFFVRNGDKKGIIDFNKNVILPIEFEYIDPHPQMNKYISLKKDDKLYSSDNNFNLTSFPYVEGKYIFKYHSDLRVHYIKYDNEKLFIIFQTNKDKSIVRTKFIGTYEELIENLVSHDDNTQYYNDYRQAIDDMRKNN